MGRRITDGNLSISYSHLISDLPSDIKRTIPNAFEGEHTMTVSSSSVETGIKRALHFNVIRTSHVNAIMVHNTIENNDKYNEYNEYNGMF